MVYRLPITGKPLDTKSIKKIRNIERKTFDKGSDHRVGATPEQSYLDVISRYDITETSISNSKARLMAEIIAIKEGLEAHELGEELYLIKAKFNFFIIDNLFLLVITYYINGGQKKY